MLISPEKNIILHNLLHNSPTLSHNLPWNIAQILIFYRTLSYGLFLYNNPNWNLILSVF